MNVQTTPAAIALAPLKGGQQNDRSFGTSKTDNAIPIEAWNTVLFGKFCRFRQIMSLGQAGHSDELFRRKSYPAGSRVLDIGFGFGDTTRLIADR
jgi:ubiquinone/menaquinone biosynthesis C-methylase UbiE